MRSYLPFIAANSRFLTYGFLAALFSSFGQTFFIAMFGGQLRAEFDLSHGQFGTLYSAATLCSGLTLIWLGAQMDRIPLGRYTAIVCLGIGGACLLMGAAPSAIVLALAFFALRLTGQGMLGHLAVVSMARAFTVSRGKAVSLASMGHPAGEAILPIVAVALSAGIGWRGAWLSFGAVLLIAMAPLMLWLLRAPGAASHGADESGPSTARGDGRDSGKPGREEKTGLRDIVRDPLFYLLLACVLAPPFIQTALFFHQVALADARDWSLSWLASCFIGFAAAQVTAGLVTGPLVDRFGTIRLLPVYLVPLGTATGLLAFVTHPLGALAYLVLAGISAGASFTVLGALWAEVYGTARLGAVRGLVQAMMVLSTAAGPVLFGALLDRGVGFDVLAGGSAFYVAAACLVLTALQVPLRARRLG